VGAPPKHDKTVAINGAGAFCVSSSGKYIFVSAGGSISTFRHLPKARRPDGGRRRIEWPNG
jgi:hypothetical protein